MTTADRSFFFKSLEEFQEERGEDSGPPLFAKKAVDQWKLWVAVQEAGGFHEVTATKGWARIGRLFDPPRTMTDLSFRIKKIYEVHLLPFEKAVEEGRMAGVYQPPRVAQAQQSLSRGAGGKPPAKRAHTGRTTPQPTSRPKRQRKEFGHSDRDGHMVGKKVKIFWPKEHKFFRGTITAYESDVGLHRVHYDDGDEDLVDLSEKEWAFDGPENDLVDTSRLTSLRDEIAAIDDEDDELFGNESDCEDLGPPKSREGLPKDCVEDRIHANRGYKVYLTEDGKFFEVFCLVPGLSLEGVRVKAWETGKVLVKHTRKAGGTGPPANPTAYRIRLPTSINAASTQAIITIHYQLYIKVPIKGEMKLPKLGGAVPQGESAVQALPSETLEQEVNPSPDDEAAISPDRSNVAISPENAGVSEIERPAAKNPPQVQQQTFVNPGQGSVNPPQGMVNPMAQAFNPQTGQPIAQRNGQMMFVPGLTEMGYINPHQMAQAHPPMQKLEIPPGHEYPPHASLGMQGLTSTNANALRQMENLSGPQANVNGGVQMAYQPQPHNMQPEHPQ